MKKVMYTAAVAGILALSVAPAMARDHGRGHGPKGPKPPCNEAPLPIAMLGLPIAGGLMAFAARKGK